MNESIYVPDVNRLDAIEREQRSLRALFNSRTSGFPFERGACYFAPGDPVPSSGSPAENLEGNIYAFKDAERFNVACRLTKNNSGNELTPNTHHNATAKSKDGVDYIVASGTVDSKLARPVSPNNFFWLEI